MPEKSDDKPKNDDKVEETAEKQGAEEAYVWVDDKGKKPLSYMLPIYLIVGGVLLTIWILIYFLAIQPNWAKKGTMPEDIGIERNQTQSSNPVRTIEIGE